MNRAKLKKRKKHADLDPIYMPRVRREFVDHDYINELNNEEKDWLSKFDSEYYGASIQKTKTGNIKKKHIHDKNEHAKELYDSNNKRNNDLYGVTRINGLLENIDGQDDGIGIADHTKSEQAMIELITYKEDIKKSYQEALILLAQVILHRSNTMSKKKPSRVRKKS
jgi:hypothetical protein